MAAIKMPVTKGRREQRLSSQIDSGGQVSTKMWIEPSKIADIVISMGEGGESSHDSNDGDHTPPAGSSQFYLIQDNHKS